MVKSSRKKNTKYINKNSKSKTRRRHSRKISKTQRGKGKARYIKKTKTTNIDKPLTTKYGTKNIDFCISIGSNFLPAKESINSKVINDLKNTIKYKTNSNLYKFMKKNGEYLSEYYRKNEKKIRPNLLLFFDKEDKELKSYRNQKGGNGIMGMIYGFLNYIGGWLGIYNINPIIQFNADSRRGWMLFEIGQQRYFMKIGPNNIPGLTNEEINIAYANNNINIENLGPYIYEALIYAKLNELTLEASQNNEQFQLNGVDRDYRDFVPRIYDYGITEYRPRVQDAHFDITIGGINYNMHGHIHNEIDRRIHGLPDEMWDWGPQQPDDNYVFHVTQSIPGYMPYFEQYINMTRENVLRLLNNTLVLIHNFYIKFGFVHWDLHNNNILTNITGDPMLFDFDFSTIPLPDSNHPTNVSRSNAYTQDIIIGRVNSIIYGHRFQYPIIGNYKNDGNININPNKFSINKLGHMYDIYRLLYDNGGARHLAGPNSITVQELNDIIRQVYPDYPYQNIYINLPIAVNAIEYDQLVQQPISSQLLHKFSVMSKNLNPGLYLNNRDAAINLDYFAKMVLTSMFIFRNSIPNIAHR